ncbi:hypothetical protein DY000_02013969 [Brassica cretica]|uniref:BTB domain-containing protein n=1 Tax=Brassica cretica TaxID=69181 RepID=A0ABQ7CX09_BRACR|nr:hypothetical protein DY000_02013969 [Brassica cretica]
MTEDPPQDPPPLPRLPPDPVFLGPDAGLRGSLLSSPSSSPMDLSPAVSVPDSTVPDKNLASSGPSPPLTGSFIFGSLSPSVPLPSVLSVDTTKTVPDLAKPGSSKIPSAATHLTSSSNPSESAYNWASNLNSASKFPPPSASVSMSADGRLRVKIPNGVFERRAKIHTDFIVGIFYGKAPSYGKIWAVLNYLWGKDRRVTIHHLAKNAYIFHIPSPSLRKRILQHELWRVGDSPFFVTEWKAEFSLNPPSLDKASVWAKIQGIPFDLITNEGLSSICTPLGRVVDAKPFTSISSAEVKVIVDLTKPLPAEVELECDNGKILVLEITYPWLPSLCLICNEIGHKATRCPASIAKEKTEFKGKGVASDTDPAKEWQTPNRKSKGKKSKKKQVDSDVGTNLAGPSSSKHVYVEKSKAFSAPAQVVSSNMFLPLQGEEPEKDSKIGSSMPLSSDGSDGSEVGGTSGAGSISEDGTLALGFPLRPSSVTGSTIQQSQSQPPSSSLVLSTGTWLNSTVFFGSSPKSSAERKKKKRKYSSPVRQGTNALEASDYLKDDCLIINCTVGVVRARLEGPKQFGIVPPPSNMGQGLKDLLDSELGCDIAFRVGEETYKAHKLILAARSPVFRAQFYGPVGNNSVDRVVIEDMDPSIFQAMLSFIYTDELPDVHEITRSTSTASFTNMIQHLLAAADLYDLGRLKILSVMKSEGFKHLNQSCPSVLPELLNTVAAADKSSTSSGQSSKKRSVSSVLGCDTSTTNARQLRRM